MLQSRAFVVLREKFAELGPVPMNGEPKRVAIGQADRVGQWQPPHHSVTAGTVDYRARLFVVDSRSPRREGPFFSLSLGVIRHRVSPLVHALEWAFRGADGVPLLRASLS